MRNKKINNNDTKPLIQRLLYYAYKFIELKQDEHKHFHPSGDPEPSDIDIAVTKKLKDSLLTIGVNLVDHLVIGRNRYESLLKMGCM